MCLVSIYNRVHDKDLLNLTLNKVDKMKLLTEFNNVTKMRMFEIEVKDEYALYDIQANEQGLYTYGHWGYDDDKLPLLLVEWDDCFSLDEHLQDLYELCENDANNAYSKGWL